MTEQTFGVDEVTKAEEASIGGEQIQVLPEIGRLHFHILHTLFFQECIEVLGVHHGDDAVLQVMYQQDILIFPWRPPLAKVFSVIGFPSKS